MKKFTKWLAVCAACLALGAVPAAGATTSVQPTVAQASVKTTKPAPKPRRGWYGTMPKKCYYGKDGQTLKGLHKDQRRILLFRSDQRLHENWLEKHCEKWKNAPSLFFTENRKSLYWICLLYTSPSPRDS